PARPAPRSSPTHALPISTLLLLPQKPPSEVIHMPPGHDEDNHTVRLQPGVGGGGPPVPRILADGLGLRLFPVLHRVIDDEDVGALTCEIGRASCREKCKYW